MMMVYFISDLYYAKSSYIFGIYTLWNNFCSTCAIRSDDGVNMMNRVNMMNSYINKCTMTKM